LDVDPETGIPRVKRDSAGDPAWHYMSPIGSRVKNGMVLSTGRGEEVVALFRFITEPPQRSLVQRIVDRLPFRMRKTDRIPLGYSLIRMSFPDYAAFLKYDTAHLMEDMLHPEALGHLSRPHPSETGVLLATADLREPYAGDPRVTMSGFGPGAKPARVTMRGDGDVYLEESFGAAPVKIGRVPPAEREAFVLKADEPKWLFLGHQLRGYQLFGAKFRDYNAFAWLTDAAMSRVERVRNALMSADSPLDAGEHSMIVDLARHNYPMGAEVMENGEYHISYGASDKHTGAAKLDVMALLREMSDGSPETREGLAYRPGATPAVSASGK
jgi:hypothetical protein